MAKWIIGFGLLALSIKNREDNMACKFICDGCGKEQPGYSNGRDWFKPSNWFERGDKDGVQTACSRECIEKVAKETGKTSVVLPI